MRTLLFTIAVLIFFSANSQKNMQPGYLVTTNGDSLVGKINYLNWTMNPREILFATPNGTETIYKLPDISRVGIIGKDYYTKAIITRSTRPVDVNFLTKSTKDSLVTDTVLLRILAKGALGLYEFKDFKEHFYLQVAGGPFQELKYEINIGENDKDILERNYFQGQLNAAVFNVTGEFPQKNKLENLHYSENDLVKFVDKVNESQGGSTAEVVHEKTSLVHFYAGAGISYNKVWIDQVDEENMNVLEFAPTISPVFQAGMDLNTSRNRQKLFLRIELAYNILAATGKGSIPESPGERPRNITYELSMNMVSPSLELFYKIISKPTIDWYMGGGYIQNFSNYTKNIMTVEYLDFGGTKVMDPYRIFESSWGQFFIKTGVIFSKKFEGVISYPLSGTFNRYSDIGAKPKYFRLQVNYRFN